MDKSAASINLAEDSLNDAVSNTGEYSKAMTETRQDISIMGNLVDIPKQSIAEVNRIIYQSDENMNLKLSLSAAVASEKDEEKLNFKAVSVQSTEGICAVTDSELSDSVSPKGGGEIVNEIVDDIISQDNSEAVLKPNSGGTDEVADMEVISLKVSTENSNKISVKAIDCVNNADKAEGILGQNAVEVKEIDDLQEILRELDAEINEIDDFQAILKECSSEVNDMMNHTDENADLSLSFDDSFDSSLEEATQNRNLSVVPVLNTENIEVMHQANKSDINTFKNIATLNPEKNYKTLNSDQNSMVSVTDSSENVETLNTEVKQLKVISGFRRKNRKRKTPPVSEMVMASIKKIKRNDGASFEDIKKQMEQNYLVKVEALLKYNVSKFLRRIVDEGYLEKVGGIDSERYKIKESEIIQK